MSKTKTVANDIICLNCGLLMERKEKNDQRNNARIPKKILTRK
jgi:hypothetical protein